MTDIVEEALRRARAAMAGRPVKVEATCPRCEELEAMVKWHKLRVEHLEGEVERLERELSQRAAKPKRRSRTKRIDPALAERMAKMRAAKAAKHAAQLLETEQQGEQGEPAPLP